MTRLFLIFLCFVGVNVMADDLPHRSALLEAFEEKRPIVEKLYLKFKKDKKINILHFRQDDQLQVSDQLFGESRPYRGFSAKKYWKLRNESWPINIPLLVRAEDNISSTVATALKGQAFVEAELNLYSEGVALGETCEQPDFSKNGECLSPISDRWALRYVWFLN